MSFSGVQAYLAGLTFALAASPCSTPVLATLLGYVAASKVHSCFLPLPFLSSSFFPPPCFLLPSHIATEKLEELLIS